MRQSFRLKSCGDKLVAECQKQVEPKKRASGKSNWKEWSEKKKEGPPAGEGGGAEKEPEKAEKPRMKKGTCEG